MLYFRINGLQEDLTMEQTAAIGRAIWALKDSKAVVMMAAIAECDEDKAFSGVRGDQFIRRLKDIQNLVLSDLDSVTIGCIRDTWRVSYGGEIWLLATPESDLWMDLDDVEKRCFKRRTWLYLALEMLRLVPHMIETTTLCLLRHFGLVVMRDHDGQYLDIYSTKHRRDDMRIILDRHFGALAGIVVEDRSDSTNE